MASARMYLENATAAFAAYSDCKAMKEPQAA
jgi:hypothetical protein